MIHFYIYTSTVVGLCTWFHIHGSSLISKKILMGQTNESIVLGSLK